MESPFSNSPPCTPEYTLQQELHRDRLIQSIETSGKITTRKPTDKVHYIVCFRDWRLTHSMALAPDVPKMGTVLSGRVNSIIDACWHSNLPSPFKGLSEKRKRIQYFLVVNIWTNRPVDLFASEQNN